MSFENLNLEINVFWIINKKPYIIIPTFQELLPFKTQITWKKILGC